MVDKDHRQELLNQLNLMPETDIRNVGPKTLADIVSREELRKMREVDIRTVDPATLVDVKDVKINTELPKEARVLDYIRQIKNPYCYLYNGMIVKVSFTGKRRLEDCLKDCLFTEF